MKKPETIPSLQLAHVVGGAERAERAERAELADGQPIDVKSLPGMSPDKWKNCRWISNMWYQGPACDPK